MSAGTETWVLILFLQTSAPGQGALAAGVVTVPGYTSLAECEKSRVIANDIPITKYNWCIPGPRTK
jgi:hypothetical protein